MNLEKKIFEIGHNAKQASIILNLLDRDRKNKILEKAALNIKNCEKKILEANKKDLIKAKEKNLNSALVDRLVLNKDRIQAICDGILAITKLEDPVGKILAKWKRPNGLEIERVSVPLGVIGVIYESRPNVAADAAAAGVAT